MVETDTADSTFVVTDLQPFTVKFVFAIIWYRPYILYKPNIWAIMMMSNVGDVNDYNITKVTPKSLLMITLVIVADY